MLVAHMTSFELPTVVAAAGVGFLAGVAVCFAVMRHMRNAAQATKSAESDR